MRRWRFTPLVLLFACLQALAPAVAAIADGLRMDERTPYAHVESETSSNCAVVHAHDCALCSVATSANGEQVAAPALPIGCASPSLVVAQSEQPTGDGAQRAASQRAPPVGRG